MATSDVGAQSILRYATVGLGASTYLGIALSANHDLTTVVEADDTHLETPRVEIPWHGSGGWHDPVGRAITAVNDTDHGLALTDFTPGWIVWWTFATGGLPLFARRLADTTIRTGDHVTVPADTIRLTYTD